MENTQEKSRKISIIVPIYNEEENVVNLQKEITEALSKSNFGYEVILVDDGSKDKSFEIMTKITEEDTSFKAIKLRKNSGQTAAISTGIDNSSGDIIVLIDADLQNDPKDIERLIEKIDEGFDVVSGWRKDRKDKFISRRLPSYIANSLISQITGVKLHDYGCTLKAYKKDVIKDVRLYGEMHRFIPAYTAWYGAKITEIVVNHRERTYGESKYGISRVFRVVLDLIVVKFLSNYMTRPIHFFGGVGFFILLLSFMSGIWAVALKVFYTTSFISTPLPLLTSILFIVGLLMILMGILAEILVRVYFETNNKKPYSIKKKLNF